MVRNLRWNLVLAAFVVAAGAGCGDDSSSAKDSGATDGGRDSGADGATGPKCGNGILETGEQCDDGNLLNTDSCSSLCRIITPPETTCAASKVIDLSTQGKVKGFVTSFTGNVGTSQNDLEPP